MTPLLLGMLLGGFLVWLGYNIGYTVADLRGEYERGP